MDPNATLQEIESMLIAGDFGESLTELLEALSGWIRGGGFEPAWRRYPLATEYYLLIYSDRRWTGSTSTLKAHIRNLVEYRNKIRNDLVYTLNYFGESVSTDTLNALMRIVVREVDEKCRQAMLLVRDVL